MKTLLLFGVVGFLIFLIFAQISRAGAIIEFERTFGFSPDILDRYPSNTTRQFAEERVKQKIREIKSECESLRREYEYEKATVSIEGLSSTKRDRIRRLELELAETESNLKYAKHIAAHFKFQPRPQVQATTN